MEVVLAEDDLCLLILTRTTNWRSLHNDVAKFAMKPMFETAAAAAQWETFHIFKASKKSKGFGP